MKERDVIDAIATDRRRWFMMMPNYTPANWWECDVFALTKAKYMVEFEVKLSRADFFADKRKAKDTWRRPRSRHGVSSLKHKRLAAGDKYGPTRFYFVVRKGMVEPEEVPNWAGLWTVHDPSEPKNGVVKKFYVPACYRLRLEEVRKAPRLHNNKVTPAVLEHAGSVCYYRYWNERMKNSRSQ